MWRSRPARALWCSLFQTSSARSANMSSTLSNTPGNSRPFAIVTGASSGIGLELAREAARHGYDLLIAADRSLDEQAAELRAEGGTVVTVEADLATREGVETLFAHAANRRVDALLANAGHGLGKGFLDQEFAEVQHVINTNITGTLDLIQRVARQMRRQMGGKILITG